MARCPHDGLKEGSQNLNDRQVGFYPFRGPDAPFALRQSYHTRHTRIHQMSPPARKSPTPRKAAPTAAFALQFPPEAEPGRAEHQQCQPEERREADAAHAMDAVERADHGARL